jgi:beta-glucan synthesis-associated protein KRE6
VRFTHLPVIRKAYTSSLQPFNFNYTYFTNDTVIYNSSITQLNSYKGGVYQQAVSALTVTDPTAYEGSEGGYSIYGFEYGPGTSNAVCNLSHAISI